MKKIEFVDYIDNPILRKISDLIAWQNEMVDKENYLKRNDAAYVTMSYIEKLEARIEKLEKSLNYPPIVKCSECGYLNKIDEWNSKQNLIDNADDLYDKALKNIVLCKQNPVRCARCGNFPGDKCRFQNCMRKPIEEPLEDSKQTPIIDNSFINKEQEEIITDILNKVYMRTLTIADGLMKIKALLQEKE